ncbi:hypothetical protein MRX96_043027 [Rhipicephalus microplus]
MVSTSRLPDKGVRRFESVGARNPDNETLHVSSGRPSSTTPTGSRTRQTRRFGCAVNVSGRSHAHERGVNASSGKCVPGVSWKGLCGEEVAAVTRRVCMCTYVHTAPTTCSSPYIPAQWAPYVTASALRSFLAAARGRIMMKHAYTRASKLLARMLLAVAPALLSDKEEPAQTMGRRCVD